MAGEPRVPLGSGYEGFTPERSRRSWPASPPSSWRSRRRSTGKGAAAPRLTSPRMSLTPCVDPAPAGRRADRARAGRRRRRAASRRAPPSSGACGGRWGRGARRRERLDTAGRAVCGRPAGSGLPRPARPPNQAVAGRPNSKTMAAARIAESAANQASDAVVCCAVSRSRQGERARARTAPCRR